MKIDFVSCVKIDDTKRQTLFRQTIETLTKNTPRELINRIVILDDLSRLPKMDYETIKEQDGLYYPIRNLTRLGIGGSKNRGVRQHTELGRGDLLYMFDCDVYFTEGWLEKLLTFYELKKDTVKLFAGGCHPFLHNNSEEIVHPHGVLGYKDAIPGWSWLMDYDTWDKYGKLADNSIGSGKSEDWEYCQRIIKDGYKVACIYPNVVAHCGLTNTEGEDIPGKHESEALARSISREAILL